MPITVASKPIKIVRKKKEGEDYGNEKKKEVKEKKKEDEKKKKEEEEVLEYPAHWTMKHLAKHATETQSQFRFVLEFCRMGISDFDEQEFTLEWIFETFNDVEKHRAFYLKENADVESESILNDCLKEMRSMFEELRSYYRKRGNILKRLGQDIKFKF